MFSELVTCPAVSSPVLSRNHMHRLQLKIYVTLFRSRHIFFFCSTYESIAERLEVMSYYLFHSWINNLEVMSVAATWTVINSGMKELTVLSLLN